MLYMSEEQGIIAEEMKSEITIMISAVAIALAKALFGGLVVVPALEETGLLQQAEAKEKTCPPNATNQRNTLIKKHFV
jgi:hypothetical protein